jgi:hypothetical protein
MSKNKNYKTLKILLIVTKHHNENYNFRFLIMIPTYYISFYFYLF